MTQATEYWRHRYPPRARADDIIAALNDRTEYGQEHFGDSFHGDPLQHLEEEMLDALVYMQVLKKKVEEESGATGVYRRILEFQFNNSGLGLSQETLVRTYMEGLSERRGSWPRDIGDRNRCRDIVKAIPEIRVAFRMLHISDPEHWGFSIDIEESLPPPPLPDSKACATCAKDCTDCQLEEEDQDCVGTCEECGQTCDAKHKCEVDEHRAKRQGNKYECGEGHEVDISPADLMRENGVPALLGGK